MTNEVQLYGIARAINNAGLLSKDVIITYQSMATEMQLDLITYLQTKNLVDENRLARLIAQNVGFNYFDFSNYDSSESPKHMLDDSKIIGTHMFPVRAINDRTILVAISNPKHTFESDKLSRESNLKVELCIAEPSKIREYQDLVYGQFSSGKTISVSELLTSVNLESTPVDVEEEVKEINEQDSSAPMVVYLNNILLNAVKMKASDLHFEPYEKNYRIRYRIDGVLKLVENLPSSLSSTITSRLKVMSGMDISEKRAPQDGRVRLKLTPTTAIDFRVSSLPTAYGEKVVLRILDPSSAKIGIDALGYEPDQKALFMEALNKPQGMILITGPTGSGKTVSLYTGLNILNTMDTNISTAEDPIEINLEGINQVGMNPKAGLTFATALKSFLRQDPDVIMVGEIRDLETAEIAIKAAQTGHMVMSTLHTNSAPETLTRLRNMGVEAFNIATSVNLVIAQRLARKLCPSCKRQADIPVEALLKLGFTEEEVNDPNFKIYEAAGCKSCSDGYKGRVGVYEVMKITPEISKLIMVEGNAIEIAELSQKLGYRNLRQSGMLKVKAGLTTIQEVMRITSD